MTIQSTNTYLQSLMEGFQDLHVQVKISDFFKNNPKPNVEQVKKLASTLSIDHDKLLNNIFEMYSDLLEGIGKHRDVSDFDVDNDELLMGMDVELEHTDSYLVAKEIAKDHLTECSDYYTRLKKMEDQCKKSKSNKE